MISLLILDRILIFLFLCVVIYALYWTISGLIEMKRLEKISVSMLYLKPKSFLKQKENSDNSLIINNGISNIEFSQDCGYIIKAKYIA